MENTKFLKLVIIALLFLNCGILLFLWISMPEHHHGPRENRPGGPFKYIVKELAMTPTQEEKYRELRDDHKSKMDVIHHESRQLQEQLFGLMALQTLDSLKANALVDAIAERQKKLEWITFDHFRKVRNLCTPEQQIKFDGMINGVLDQMFHKGPPSDHHRTLQPGDELDH